MKHVNYVAVTGFSLGFGMGSLITSIAAISNPDDVVGVATGGVIGSALCLAFAAGAILSKEFLA